MPPTLILIRHAEGWHNAKEDWDLPDPTLTPLGEQQCLDLQNHLRQHCPLAEQVDVIISSPMRRALQTTTLGLEWLIKRGVKIEVDAAWQENSDKPCDTGTDLKVIADEYPSLDFSLVDPVFPNKGKGTAYAFSRSVVQARGRRCLRKLVERPEKVIAVVSHSAFLRTTITHRRFANADFRIFTFGRVTRNEIHLVEDSTTDRTGGGLGRSPIGPQKVNHWDFPPETVEEPDE